MPRIRRPFFWASRRPGKPCWTWRYQGRTWYHPDRTLTADDREEADRWWRALVPDVAPELVPLLDQPRANSPPRLLKLQLRPEEIEALHYLAREAGTHAAALDQAIRAELGRSDREPVPPLQPESSGRVRRLDTVCRPETRQILDELARRYAVRWGLRRPNRSATARVAIRREYYHRRNRNRRRTAS